MRLTVYTDFSLRVLMYVALHRDRLPTIAEIAGAKAPRDTDGCVGGLAKAGRTRPRDDDLRRLRRDQSCVHPRGKRLAVRLDGCGVRYGRGDNAARWLVPQHVADVVARESGDGGGFLSFA